MRLSTSKIKTFKACRRLYELKYIEHLEPVQKSEALETGSNYHQLLEQLNNTGSFDEGITKEHAMASAYKKYIYPNFHVTEAEKYVEYNLGDDDLFIGIIDGIADDGHIVEHKSTGQEITEQYEYNLQWDEQILAYMMMSGHRKVWYTVCRKPTIRQKQNESDEEFFQRMCEWYDTDTDSKIRLLEITRTDEEIEAYRRDLQDIKKVIALADVNKEYYRNTCHCDKYGKRCEYSSVCMFYDPNQQYVEFVKGEEYEPKKD